VLCFHLLFVTPLAARLTFSAFYSKTTEYGTTTYHEHLAHSSRVPMLSLWFTVVSSICFGVPFIHRRRITLAQHSSELRGDEKIWPVYIEFQPCTGELALISISQAKLPSPILSTFPRSSSAMSSLTFCHPVFVSIPHTPTECKRSQKGVMWVRRGTA